MLKVYNGTFEGFDSGVRRCAFVLRAAGYTRNYMWPQNRVTVAGAMHNSEENLNKADQPVKQRV